MFCYSDPVFEPSAFAADWSDRGEYDLVLTIRAEAATQKRLQLLDQWKQKYPGTPLRQMRSELYLVAYESLGDSTHMLAVAHEMLVDEPDNFVGLYWATLLAPEAKETSKESLAQAEQSGRRLLASLDRYFAAGQKPSWMKDEEWKKQRTNAELLSYRTIGWAAWQKAEYSAAEQEFTKALARRPNDPEITSWLGIVLALEKEPAKQVAGLWHLAHAARNRDEGLPDVQQRQVNSMLERAYISYHGSVEGLDRLRDASQTSEFPPAGFIIEPAELIAARRADEELNRTDPELAAWVRIRKRLAAADGDSWFTSSLQGTALPKLKGTLVRMVPATRPDELVLAVSDPTAEDLVVKVNSRLPNEADPGTVLTIEGTADSFTRNPFTLRVLSNREKIGGWPAPASRSRK